MRRLALLAVFLALPALAADADFYQRTGTKPPVCVDGFLGPRLPFADGGVGFGLQGGVLFDKTYMLTISADAVHLDGLHGEVTNAPPSTFAWPPRPVTLPYQTPDRTVGVVTIGVSFWLNKPK